MSQETCAEVKKMLKDMQETTSRLRSVFDSGGSVEEIKKGMYDMHICLMRHKRLRFDLMFWEKRSKRVQRVKEISEKQQKGEQLSIGDLHVLYQIDGGLFGEEPWWWDRSDDEYRSIYDIIKTRRESTSDGWQVREDYARIYGCAPKHVALASGEFDVDKDMVVFSGTESIDEVRWGLLPKTLQHVSGDFSYPSFSEKDSFDDLEYMGGNCDLTNYQSFIPPKVRCIRGDLLCGFDNEYLISLEGALSYVGGNMDCSEFVEILPAGLTHVGKTLRVGPKVQHLPDSLSYVNELYIAHSAVTKLPTAPFFVGTLYISKTRQERGDYDALFKQMFEDENIVVGNLVYV